MRYGIGLDIGIASVGSAVVLLDSNNEPYKIYRLASRVFPKAEESDGSSLALKRRNNRGMRRRLRRKQHRKERVRNLICENFAVDDDYIDSLYEESGLSDIYKIRYEALERKLSQSEFIRLLIHLSQRRGFKSNRKADAAKDDGKSEDGALLSAVSANKTLMESKGYRTIGEMLYCDEKFAEFKRNKGGHYSNTFSRADYEKEIKYIFEMQRKFENEYAAKNLEEHFISIVMSQRSFDEGPGYGKDSKYSGNQIEKMFGRCTFEPDEMRAPKASYSFEYFNLLSKINAIKIISDGTKRSLSAEERDIVKNLAFAQKEITYSSIRRALSLSDRELFNISYIIIDDKQKKAAKNKGDHPFADRDSVEKKTKFSYLQAYHVFRKAYGEDYDGWNIDKRNYLSYVLTAYKTDQNIKIKLEDDGFTNDEIQIALTITSFSKTGNLSAKAMNKMIPFLEQGYLYNEAAEKAGYHFRADDRCAGMYLPANKDKAPELEDIVNPVVRRAVSQTIKVVNAIIREMGESPVYINIELARELSKSYDDRAKTESDQKRHQKNNEQMMDEIRKEFKFANPSGQDLLKLRLWKEQNGRCMYSGEPIERSRLFEQGYAEIDHIVPYSISYDDSIINKVLVITKENREKSNRLPLEYMTGKKADEFRIRVSTSALSSRKKNHLLKESISEEDLNGFKKRNLQDTQYISRFMVKFIKKYLQFAGEPKVTAVNGKATAYIRKRWGIRKIRENGDCHHAVDACVIACTTPGMVQRISVYSKYKEKGKKIDFVDSDGKYYDLDRKTGELLNLFPMPYPTFRKELEMLTSNDPKRVLGEISLPNYSSNEQLEPIFVSRMPNHKVSGQAHEETIRKPMKADGENYVIQKVSLTSLRLDKDGEIANYFNPTSDVLLYEALKRRLTEFGGKADKAFEEPFYKPKKDGTQGPLVKKVKTMEKRTLSVPLAEHTAAADNGSMVRVDVFYVEGEGYYLVPIYVSDTVKKELPNRAIVAHKPYDQWKIMDDKDFLFSLYSNDLIKITSKKEMKFSLVNKDSTLDKEYWAKTELLYYKSTDITTGSIKVINNDNTYMIRGLGVKTLISIEKHEVDVLGRIRKVNKEKRMGF